MENVGLKKTAAKFDIICNVLAHAWNISIAIIK